MNLSLILTGTNCHGLNRGQGQIAMTGCAKLLLVVLQRIVFINYNFSCLLFLMMGFYISCTKVMHGNYSHAGYFIHHLYLHIIDIHCITSAPCTIVCQHIPLHNECFSLLSGEIYKYSTSTCLFEKRLKIEPHQQHY